MLTVRASGLHVGRGNAAIAGPFDFELTGGTALVVTGPNGAGKSTLLRTLAGLLRPIAGEIALSGVNAADGEPAERLADVAHYVGHRHGMKTAITVGENLAFWQRYLGGQSQPGLAGVSPAAALAAVGLPGLERIPFAYLSAGQQRRASLARLLVAKRPVWLLDEPTSALDVASQARFAGLVHEHLAEGGVVIAATHQPLGLETAETLQIASRGAPEAGATGVEIDEADLAAAEGWL